MAWKQDELAYIVELLVNRGNKSVPADAIVSYLKTQAKSASKDGEWNIAISLAAAAGMWETGDYDNAQTTVALARDGERV